jgi:hypothetical protein
VMGVASCMRRSFRLLSDYYSSMSDCKQFLYHSRFAKHRKVTAQQLVRKEKQSTHN